ncbi:hypothetical protein ILUMI_06164 [Ignelater luminosus]|uniref:Uncharacterized protein n=1 Tax=Ignelater luminosus TaxID=2038154 RepID=A0A8K0DBM3_IGNLU|nr:hypothetical protein ILUMI_06164 [Ignelater luminosus]
MSFWLTIGEKRLVLVIYDDHSTHVDYKIIALAKESNYPQASPSNFTLTAAIRFGSLQVSKKQLESDAGEMAETTLEVAEDAEVITSKETLQKLKNSQERTSKVIKGNPPKKHKKSSSSSDESIEEQLTSSSDCLDEDTVEVEDQDDNVMPENRIMDVGQ